MHARLKYGVSAVVAFLSLGSMGRPLSAQALGPQRQFLAVEPYYQSLWIDVAPNQSRTQLNGFGARLWINLAPFVGPQLSGLSRSSVSAFVSRAPASKGFDVWHFGGELDQFFVRRPLGGFIDPLISVGAGALRVTGPLGTNAKFALSPGVGLRIPMPNRFELRVDGRDLLVFNRADLSGPQTPTRTANNIELTAGLGITF